MHHLEVNQKRENSGIRNQQELSFKEIDRTESPWYRGQEESHWSGNFTIQDMSAELHNISKSAEAGTATKRRQSKWPRTRTLPRQHLPPSHHRDSRLKRCPGGEANGTDWKTNNCDYRWSKWDDIPFPEDVNGNPDGQSSDNFPHIQQQRRLGDHQRH